MAPAPYESAAAFILRVEDKRAKYAIDEE